MESHLLQMRGLKQTSKNPGKETSSSHLLQMRGLKLELDIVLFVHECRIFYRCVD